MQEQSTFICETPERLDKFLSHSLETTRNQVLSLIKDGHVSVDDKVVTKTGLKLKSSQSIHINFPEPVVTEPLNIDFDVEILYEDDDVLVINKPKGLTVHPAPSVKDATLVDWLKHKGIRLSTISGEERHGIVHRLDKGTTGVMVVAKNNLAHEALSQQLQDRTMGRFYLAIINIPLKDNIIIDKPIARNGTNRLKMAVVEGGKDSKTQFTKLYPSIDEKTELITCKLFSGRTHQIRVHLESIGREIKGDHLYGFKSKEDKISEISLHAYILYFVHPTSGEVMEFIAPLQENMKNYLNNNFDMEYINEAINPTNFSRHFTSI
ncbi:RluA family pseudouridine synthase [Sulfurimonas sp. MAG313]|nr:RluA family pseudouridine synthase [Sulfurimonas sp. MAG313]MDF1881618.1 RluA family pseudouridine synthase [Sulfurimonas sp. MAG313]